MLHEIYTERIKQGSIKRWRW